MALVVRGVLLLFLEGLAEGGELLLLGIIVVVEQGLVEVLAKGVDFHFELDHVGGLFSFEGDNKNSLSIWLDKLLQMVVVAFGIGFFELFFQVVSKVLIADNQIVLVFSGSCHGSRI